MELKNPETYDAILIGVGQGGKPLALALAENGQRVAVIERQFVGGSCINYGCTPTKTLIASAKAAHEARRAAQYGIETGAVRVHYAEVKKLKDEVVQRFRHGVQKGLDKAENLILIRGEATFLSSHTIQVSLSEGGNRVLTADRIFIDCGTSPRKPDLDGLDEVDWLTSTSLMELEELPEHLIVLGGGYIGLEFGQMFRRFGSEVTIIERKDHLLSQEDKDIADEIAGFLNDEGIHIHLNSKALRVEKTSSGLRITLVQENQKKEITGSHLLIAIGQAPNTPALHLEVANIETDKKGFIRVNELLETSQPGVYALGDIKGGPAFTHISYDDYRIVKQNLLNGGQASTSGRMVPYTVFTDPQLGRIGLSEKEARAQNLKIKVASMPMSSVARAIETSHTTGLMKVVIDAKTDQILGAAILGMEGGEIMSMLQIAMMGQLPYTRLRDAIFAHPTLAESLNNLFMKIDESP